MTENTHKIFVTTGASNHAQNDRASYDFYCTDPKALEMLLEKRSFNSFFVLGSSWTLFRLDMDGAGCANK